MSSFLAAIATFILSHMIPMRPRFRNFFEQRLGRTGFLISYSVLSLVVIYWLGYSFAQAPYIGLWGWSEVAAWLPVILMPLACMLVVAGMSSRNPFSLGLGKKGYDPSRPGITSVTRHPVLWGLILWSSSHIPVNGDVAGLILFGLMLMLSVAGTLMMERVRRRKFSPEVWQRYLAGTAGIPFSRVGSIDWRGIGWLRIAAGGLLYLLLLFGHQPIIGIAPPILY